MKSILYLNYYKNIIKHKKYYMVGFDLDWTIIKPKYGKITKQPRHGCRRSM